MRQVADSPSSPRGRHHGIPLANAEAAIVVDVEEIATALADQTDYEHRWLIDPRTGDVAFWTSDTGIDGQNPIELDELDLIPIDPLPAHV